MCWVPAHAWSSSATSDGTTANWKIESSTSLELYKCWSLRPILHQRWNKQKNAKSRLRSHLWLFVEPSCPCWCCNRLFNRFISSRCLQIHINRGCPMKMWSNQGSQLRLANKEIKKIASGHERKLMDVFGATHSFYWSFSTLEAPWQNGCAEILIKAVQKAIELSMGNQILTHYETQTVFFESANLVNEWPVGRHPTSVEDGCYLSSNDLLLGW